MINFEKTEVVGFEAAIRGMRNPKNSWNRSDSYYQYRELDETYHFVIGENDHVLMKHLAKGGPVHAKYARMIQVYADITAPLYWWKEFDTYKVGTVANSCSTMHKIHDKEFELSDFSHEHLTTHQGFEPHQGYISPKGILLNMIDVLNYYRELYNREDDPDTKKLYWWQMIQLLPSSYNQKRTVMLGYEVLAGMRRDRKTHKLDEWREFCKWADTLPYSELIRREATVGVDIGTGCEWGDRIIKY